MTRLDIQTTNILEPHPQLPHSIFNRVFFNIVILYQNKFYLLNFTNSLFLNFYSHSVFSPSGLLNNCLYLVISSIESQVVVRWQILGDKKLPPPKHIVLKHCAITDYPTCNRFLEYPHLCKLH